MRLISLLILCALTVSAQDSKFSGPSDANPPVTEADLRIVHRAREILNSPAKWNRADNRECPPAQKTYSLYCALEKATTEVSKKFEHRAAVMQQARFAMQPLRTQANGLQQRSQNDICRRAAVLYYRRGKNQETARYSVPSIAEYIYNAN